MTYSFIITQILVTTGLVSFCRMFAKNKDLKSHYLGYSAGFTFILFMFLINFIGITSPTVSIFLGGFTILYTCTIAQYQAITIG